MQLEVPLFRQPERSAECGPASIQMLLAYYGVETSREEILADIPMKEGGTVGPELGLYLLRHGFEVEIVTMHPRLFNIASNFETREALISHLESLESKMKGEWNPWALSSFIQFIKEGGAITPKVPDLGDIRDEITEKRPLISLLTHWFLFDSGLPPRFTGHFNVVTGIDESFVYVNDPDWGDPFGGKHAHGTREYMYAVHASAYQSADNASLIKVKRK
ncbi:hypothetical protein BH11PAT4_BH11PAT4_0540 [soil metagenome]